MKARFARWLREAKHNFDKRFADLNDLRLLASFFTTPQEFNVTNSEVLCSQLKVSRKDFESELLELKADYEVTRMDVKAWAACKYATLRLVACKVLSFFGSTYNCESTFSGMKLTKSKLRSSLTDANLECHLLCAVSNSKPDFSQLVKQKSCQTSH